MSVSTSDETKRDYLETSPLGPEECSVHQSEKTLSKEAKRGVKIETLNRNLKGKKL